MYLYETECFFCGLGFRTTRKPKENRYKDVCSRCLEEKAYLRSCGSVIDEEHTMGTITMETVVGDNNINF